MESILTIDLKNNQDFLEDFEGVEPGDTIKVTAEFQVSEFSENKLSAPLDALVSVELIGDEEEEEPVIEEGEGEVITEEEE